MATVLKKMTPLNFLEKKRNGEKLCLLTAYDYQMAKALEFAGIDAFIVGDSCGMVLYGYPSTIPVTLHDIIRHSQAVARGTSRAMVIADMPFMTYASLDDGVKNAGRCIQEGNADAVKIEGGRERIPLIKLLVENGIPVQGHIGLTPQSFHQLGGYRLQGKTAEAAYRLVEDATLLEQAGIFSLVLEMVPQQVAKEISSRLKIPTIGIGAGVYCDGQVLVSQDMMGFAEQVKMKFVKQYARVWDLMVQSAQNYIEDVKTSQFPTSAYSFEMDPNEFTRFLDTLHSAPHSEIPISRSDARKSNNNSDSDIGVQNLYGN